MKQLNIFNLNEYMEEARKIGERPVIEEFLYEGDLALMSATAKTGKSILSMNLALEMSREGMFLNRFQCTNKNILIIQTEVSPNQYTKRIDKMLEVISDANFNRVFIARDSIKLDNDDDLKKLQSSILDNDIKLLILDPFYTLHSKDENRSSEISQVLGNLKSLLLKTNSACLLIHHQGKRGELNTGKQVGHTHRGSSSFADVPDLSMSLRRTSKNGCELSFECRNIEAPEPIPLRLNNETLIFETSSKTIFAQDPFQHATSMAMTILEVSGGELSQPELSKQMRKALNKSETTIKGYLKRFREEQKFTVTKNGNTNFISLPRCSVDESA